MSEPLVSRVLPLILLVLAVLVAAPAAEAAKRKVPRGFYGVMWDRDATRAAPGAQEEQWALMARSGVESARTVFSWEDAQPVAGGPIGFAYTDEVVARAARHGLSLLPVLLHTPGWARRYPAEQASPPARAADFTRFTDALVTRYGPRGSFWAEHPELPRLPIRAWQLWNEPHFDKYWYTPGSWSRSYAALLKPTYRAIKRADPGARVVLAGLADYSWRHLARLNRSKIRRYFDVAAINLFTAKPKNVLRGARYVRRAMRRAGEARKPLWITETTWPASKGRVRDADGAAKRWGKGWETTSGGMARKLSAFYALAAKHRRRYRLGRVYWYTWASAYREQDRFDYGGLLRFDGNIVEPRPALAAYARSARRFQGCAKNDAGRCR